MAGTSEKEPERPAAHPPAPPGRVPALLPPCLFAAAIAFFAGALVLAPVLVGELRVHFYQARVLALTHMLTLGWISTAMTGVLYRYVPGLAKRPLPFPRLAVVQAVVLLAGIGGLVASFWLGRWRETAWAADALVVSALLLGANLWPLVLRAPRWGVAEAGVGLAVGFFVAAAAVGFVLASDKLAPVLGGSTLTNLAAHAHLAAIGWVGVTISALTFRFVPAFLLPTVLVPEAARWQVHALAAAVVLLATALLWSPDLVVAAALAVAAALLAYLWLLARTVASHRMPIDWTARHAVASALWLLAATLGGVVLAVAGVQEVLGAHLAAAYGVAGILGWMSNLLIGMSYKLFPGFVAAARTARARPAAPVATLAVPARVQRVVFVLFNGGVLAVVAGLVADGGALLGGGTLVLAAGGLGYAGWTARTLAFCLVDPRRAPPLPVL